MNANAILAKTGFELNRATTQQRKPLVNLSSGKNQFLKTEDAGGYAVSQKLGSHKKIEKSLSTNLQNMISFTQTQDGVLENASRIVNRMSQLASLATNALISDSDRENYNKEFLSLADQLNDLSSTEFNGVRLFGSGTAGLDYITSSSGLDYANKVGVSPDPDTGSIGGSDAGGGGDLDDSSVVPDVTGQSGSNYTPITSGGDSAAKTALFATMQNQWLKSAEDLIATQYGWVPDTADGWNLIINENDANGSVAQVGSLLYSNGTANIVEMQMDLPDFSPPYIEGDRIIAHEMVHVLHGQNTYFADPTGDGSSSAKWLKEGLAEFIHGGDSSGSRDPGPNPIDDEIRTLIDAIGTGNEDWANNDQYAAAYLAVRFLHSEIKAAGQADGIKHMTQWMKSQFDATAGAANSGLDAYISNFLSGRGYSNNDEFLKTFKGQEDLEVTTSGTGQSTTLSSITLPGISDTNSFNLTTQTKASDALTQLESILQNLATERAKIGSNVSIMEGQLDFMANRGSAYASSLSRLEDAQFDEESTKLARAKLLQDFNLTMISQANQISGTITQILLQ